jgi:hypothetical protein
MTDDLDDLEVDEADLILVDLIDLALQHGISALELVRFAVERIPQLHAEAMADMPRH